MQPPETEVLKRSGEGCDGADGAGVLMSLGLRVSPIAPPGYGRQVLACLAPLSKPKSETVWTTTPNAMVQTVSLFAGVVWIF